MVSKKKKRNGNGGSEPEKDNDDGGVAGYEQSREQRIKENLQRMHSLGILHLSRNLKPPPKHKPKTLRPQKPLHSLPGSPRRSSRIKTLPTVSYVDKRAFKSEEKVIKDVKIEIKEGSQPEVYTEEHEKALRDHKETWTLCVDGYDEEGNRIYDTFEGKSCHQCRQKTTGLRTKCCKCKSVQGQFCGDCLFMRYGENVLEANANPEWDCPVCRDICNCSRCRRVKGWEPTGNLYRKALYLGFKSVAHYLIQTRGPNGKRDDREDIANETSASSKDADSATDKEDITNETPADKEDITDESTAYSKDADLSTDKKEDASDGKLVFSLDDKDDDKMHEDSKHVQTVKNIKRHGPHRVKKRKRDDDDDDEDDDDYKADPLDEDSSDEDEDSSDEDEDSSDEDD